MKVKVVVAALLIGFILTTFAVFGHMPQHVLSVLSIWAPTIVIGSLVYFVGNVAIDSI